MCLGQSTHPLGHCSWVQKEPRNFFSGRFVCLPRRNVPFVRLKKKKKVIISPSDGIDTETDTGEASKEPRVEQKPSLEILVWLANAEGGTAGLVQV